MFEFIDAPPRMLAVWVPDWPVLTHARARRIPEDDPIALIEKGAVLACSAAAREDGVRRGLRLREAQARCPSLAVLPYDAALDARAFEPVIAGLEQALPGVHPVRPGALAVRARGPARYYGGERAAALSIAGVVREQVSVTGWDGAVRDGAVRDGAVRDSAVRDGAVRVGVVRVGVADGLFAAQLAARASDSVTLVPSGEAAEFLAPMPVRVLEDPELGSLLPRLGIRTLGAFAALDAADVAGRFGPAGARLHALAGGRDPRTATPRIPPRDVEARVDFEPPLDRVDQVAFGMRLASDAFVQELLAQKLVATAIRVELIGDRGEASERVWLHPRSFSPSEVVDRVRWQLQGATRPGGTGGGELRSPIARVRVTPDAVDPVGRHEAGLWGTGPDERVHSGLSRVQGMIGHRGVLTATETGGRMPGDRQGLTAWGDRPVRARDARAPWPGGIPDPAPATVYELPRELLVEDARGAPVAVDDRGILSAVPAEMVAATGGRRRITSWAGPWPLEERWWDPEHARRANRFQVVDESGEAWLLVLDDGGWWAEARYD